MSSRASFILLCAGAVALAACGAGAPRVATPDGQAVEARTSTPQPAPEVDVARARAAGAPQLFEWAPFEPASFERARREGRFVLIHGAAAWCHWCHVMEAVTYRDPEIGRILRDRFVAIRVDIDARPDIAERYGDWGWPATIILAPDATELGKLRGYQPPDALRAVFEDLAEGSPERAHGEAGSAQALADLPATPEALPWAVASALYAMDDYYDDDLGGWGRRQKSPLGENLEVEARRAARGDAAAKARLAQTIAGQRALLDPVWGGVYQYSDSKGWASPHFEKLMEYQAENLEAYAWAHRSLGDAATLADARAIASYMTAFLMGGDGAFFVSQDADVGGHDASARFIDGHVFYAADDAGRRALGMPRVDSNVYALENGRAISAFVALHGASHDPADLAVARRAADRMLTSHVGPDGAVLHDATLPSAPRFLADTAALGRALTELGAATHDARYREAAVRVADAMLRDFAAPGGGLYATTADPGAIGVFAVRRRPFDAGAEAARFLGSLAELTGEARFAERGRAVLASLSTPRRISEQGRILGAYLLAADVLGLVHPPEDLVR